MGDAGKKAGQAAVAAVCSLVYGGIKGGIQIAQGDGWGGSETIADSLCPVGIGSIYGATENFIRGNTSEGIQNTVEALLPGSLLDPVTAAGSAATGALAADAAEKIMGGDTGDDPPAAKPEDPKQEAEDKEEEKEDARDITNQQANTARKAAYQAAINAGVTPAQAQAAADAQTPIGNYAGNYAALSGAGANARAAYRERQGYADALSRETENLENARTKAITASALSGGGSGAQTGLSLFGN